MYDNWCAFYISYRPCHQSLRYMIRNILWELQKTHRYESEKIKGKHDKNKFVCELHIPFLRTLRPTAPFLPHTRTHTNIHKHTLIHTTVLFHKPPPHTHTLEERQNNSDLTSPFKWHCKLKHIQIKMSFQASKLKHLHVNCLWANKKPHLTKQYQIKNTSKQTHTFWKVVSSKKNILGKKYEQKLKAYLQGWRVRKGGVYAVRCQKQNCWEDIMTEIDA